MLGTADYNRPLYVTAESDSMIISQILIDPGSSINLMSLKALRSLCLDVKHLKPDKLMSSGGIWKFKPLQLRFTLNMAIIEVSNHMHYKFFALAHSGCFVEKRLVDFGEFISRNLRVYLACELVFFFVSSYKNLRVFFVLASNLFLLYASDHSICILLLSIFKAQRLVVWKVVGGEQGSKFGSLVEDKAWLISAVVDRLVCNL
ncbi:hypothetical protein M5K25_012921 [Dendrobium thyrsiflorum]|uniref:Uncharacterized protein n=1 Tax=Dendrobium thyrsiflorum TaxID=117978 RepID=A0ABD0V5G7_DENTH